MMIDNIPEELKQRTQWVVWKLEKRKDGAKPTKVPYNINGERASSTDPSHWSSFEEALAAYEGNKTLISGIGYVFAENDPYTGVDIDGCIVNGKLQEDVRDIILNLNSYTERSQSKNGVHVLVKGRIPGERNRTGKFEMYDRDRFFVVTGDHVKHTPEGIEERQGELNKLYEHLFNPKETKREINTVVSPTQDDEIVIELARSAKNGPKFEKLYSGGWSAYNSRSEAEQAFCNMLAFYTRDPEQIDRLFRSSGLMRDKWERDDYHERTINKALEGVTEQYQGKKNTSQRTQQNNSILPQDDDIDETDFIIDVPIEWNETLPESALYGLAGDVVRLIEPHSEADPAALLINFLTMFGNIVGSSPHFVAGGDTHHMKLFSVLVGKSFEGKKGSSLPPVMSLFRAIDADFMKRKKSGLSSGEGIIYAIRDPIYNLVEKKDGEGKGAKSTGSFEEVLADPGVEDKRLLLVEAEFGGVLNVMRRDGSKLSAIVREAWDGTGDIGVITKNPIQATNTHISILGHITPDELKSKMNETEMFNGFANRFLWLYVKRSKSLPSGGAFHKVDVGEITQRITGAVEHGQSCGTLERDNEAEILWAKLYSKLETDAPGLVGAATSRAIPYVMRIACLYALLDSSNIVRVDHLRAALSLWDHCKKSAWFVFSKKNQNDPIGDKIVEALKNQPKGLSGTEISVDVFHRNVKSDDLKSALKKLSDNGLISVATDKSGKGRPKQIYKINDTKMNLSS